MGLSWGRLGNTRNLFMEQRVATLARLAQVGRSSLYLVSPCHDVGWKRIRRFVSLDLWNTRMASNLGGNITRVTRLWDDLYRLLCAGLFPRISNRDATSGIVVALKRKALFDPQPSLSSI